MERYLLTVLDVLSQEDQDQIQSAAKKNGFTALFFKTPQEAEAMLPKAEIIFGQEPELADNVPSLRWLCTSSAGINQFTGKAVFRDGQAILTNSSGAYGVTISEHIVMVLLEILRHQKEYTKIIEQKQWIRSLPLTSIFGSRITLMGTGNIGQETATRLRSFSPKSLIGMNRGGSNPGHLFDRIILPNELDTVLPQTDILIIALPGTAGTEGMLGEKQLALLPDGAVVINVGRGSIIEQDALEKELRKGRLSAALDVFQVEPIPDDAPIWTCPNLLITPHVSGNMTLPHTVCRIMEMFLEDLDNYSSGQPMKHRVDITQGY